MVGDKTVKLVTVHIVDKGKPLYEKPPSNWLRALQHIEAFSGGPAFGGAFLFDVQNRAAARPSHKREV